MLEILAPAGNIESLKVAVASGANAVYLGAKSFNARAKAGNFDENELKEAVDYCHVFGVKVYLTINTMIKQKELSDVYSLIRSSALCNIDAFIVADLGLISLIKGATNIPVHLSTQAGINNLEGAILAKELGVQRVILARETPINEIKRIKSALPDLELECFVHGALCVGFSGQCLFSSSRNGDSGNRGRCRQLCRLKYTSSLGKSGYLLSPRDICLIDEVNELKNAGITSFKIEGRLKSAEYVGAVTRAYRRAVDGILTENDLTLMKLAFNRSNGTAYINGANDGIIDPIIQNHRGIEIGKVVKTEFVRGLSKVSFEINSRNGKIAPQKGDGVKFLTDDGAELGGGEISEIAGKFAVVYSNSVPKTGSLVALTRATKAFTDILVEKKLPIAIKFIAKRDIPVVVEARSCDARFEYSSNVIPQIASKAPIDVNSVKKQLTKAGDTEFIVRNCEIILDDGLFLPVSVLNDIRRTVLAGLKQEILLPYQKSFDSAYVPNFEHREIFRPEKNICSVKNANQLSSELLEFFDVIVYSPFETDEGKFGEFFDALDNFDKANIVSVCIEIPTILVENDIKVLYKTLKKYNTRIEHLLINNLSGIKIARNLGFGVIFGQSFNIANNLFPFDGEYVASAELSKAEQEKVGGYIFSEGRLPLMRMKHCVMKANSVGNCSNCKYLSTLYYTDGKYSFPIERIKVANCSFLLYNSVRTGLSGKVSPKGLYMDFYGYSPDEIKEVVYLYQNSLPANGKTSQYFKNGVQ